VLVTTALLVPWVAAGLEGSVPVNGCTQLVRDWAIMCSGHSRSCFTSETDGSVLISPIEGEKERESRLGVLSIINSL
jgi:hypothetical protein